jgi:hypothetical protein
VLSFGFYLEFGGFVSENLKALSPLSWCERGGDMV